MRLAPLVAGKETYIFKTPFEGDLLQLKTIFTVLGVPKEEMKSLPAAMRGLNWKGKEGSGLPKSGNGEFDEVLEGCLKLDVKERMTCEEVLGMKFWEGEKADISGYV